MAQSHVAICGPTYCGPPKNDPISCVNVWPNLVWPPLPATAQAGVAWVETKLIVAWVETNQPSVAWVETNQPSVALPKMAQPHVAICGST